MIALYKEHVNTGSLELVCNPIGGSAGNLKMKKWGVPVYKLRFKTQILGNIYYCQRNGDSDNMSYKFHSDNIFLIFAT